MAKSKRPEGPDDDRDTAATVFRRRRTGVQARQRSQDGAWEFEHPRCVRERADDLEEVQAMLEAGEDEIAVDELRWLLDGCPDFIVAHRLLGEQALAAGDLKLARAHFGHAVELGWSALPAKRQAPLPYRLPANQAYLEAAKGLAHCLHALGKTPAALAVVEHLLECDPTDPLGARGWHEQWTVPPDATPPAGA